MDRTPSPISALAAMPFLLAGLVILYFTGANLWRHYSPFYSGPPGSFDFIIRIGSFTLYEPWSSILIAVAILLNFSAASAIWRQRNGIFFLLIAAALCDVFLYVGL